MAVCFRMQPPVHGQVKKDAFLSAKNLGARGIANLQQIK